MGTDSVGAVWVQGKKELVCYENRSALKEHWWEGIGEKTERFQLNDPVLMKMRWWDDSDDWKMMTKLTEKMFFSCSPTHIGWKLKSEFKKKQEWWYEK